MWIQTQETEHQRVILYVWDSEKDRNDHIDRMDRERSTIDRLTDSLTPTKWISLIKMCLNKISIESLQINNVSNELLLILLQRRFFLIFSNFALECIIRKKQ
jgi:hypothetical protein